MERCQQGQLDHPNAQESGGRYKEADGLLAPDIFEGGIKLPTGVGVQRLNLQAHGASSSFQGAMHVLYVRHSVRVYRFVLRLTNDSSLAEDIVSEVFIDVWRGARGFKEKSQVSTWLL